MTWPDSPSGGLLGDGLFANATDRPETVDALRQLVRDRVDQGHALYPQGGATALDYGGSPRRPGVAVDTRSLCRVIDYPAADMTITVEAGITLGALRAVLAAESQRLLIDAPHPDLATLGAIFATNTSGPRRYGAGRPRDQVIGVSFVTSDGALVKGGGRVVKNVAGYDFPRLLTGSMGTLGILVQLTLKVRPIPESSAVVWVPFKSPETLATALDALNSSGTRPMALEVLNRSGARIVGEPLGLPIGEWILAVGFEDNATSVAWQVEQLKTELRAPEFLVRDGKDSATLWTALTEFQAAAPGTISVVANLRPSSVVSYARRLDPAVWAVHAHAGNGIVRAHRLLEDDLDRIAPAIDQMRAEAVADGGNLIVSRAPAAWKPRLRVWGEPRGDWALAERIKNAFDPAGVMNPGRFVGTI